MAYVVAAGTNKIKRKLGSFELIGCDIMIDENFRPFLIEMNTNPALEIDTSVKEQIIPRVV